MKLEWSFLLLVKLSFRELRDSKLSGFCTFDNVAISLSQKKDKKHKSNL